ncbi:PPE family protein [Mycobacterium tuberculosis]|nr:PPE family protein [Mycobacterium tuberculosis]
MTSKPTPSPQEVMTVGRQVMSAIPDALRALSWSPLSTVDACLATVTSPLSKMSSLTTPSDVALTHLSSVNKAAALRTAASMLSQLKQPGVAARARRATSIGSLSVPFAWTDAVPAAGPGRRVTAASRTPS